MDSDDIKTPTEGTDNIEAPANAQEAEIKPTEPSISLEDIQSLKDAIKSSTEALKASAETIKNLQEQNAKQIKELTQSYEEQMNELRNNLPHRSYGHVNIEGYYDFNKVENKFYMEQTNKDKERGMNDLKNLVANF